MDARKSIHWHLILYFDKKDKVSPSSKYLRNNTRKYFDVVKLIVCLLVMYVGVMHLIKPSVLIPVGNGFVLVIE